MALGAKLAAVHPQFVLQGAALIGFSAFVTQADDECLCYANTSPPRTPLSTRQQFHPAAPVLLAGTNTLALACSTGAAGKTFEGIASVPAVVVIDDDTEW